MAISVVQNKYNELLVFFQTWIPKILPSVNLYLEGQASPRPDLPYVGFNPIDSFDRVGIDERRVDSQGNETLRGQRIITSTVTAYADSTSRFDGQEVAWALLQELRFSLGYPEIEELLCGINCRVIDEGNVVNSSQTLNTTNEPRATWTFTLSTAMAQPIDSGQIATITANGEFDNSLTPIITVTKP